MNATPEPKQKNSNNQKTPAALNMRRVDIESVLDIVPEPELFAGAHLVQILFKIGPSKSEAPIDEFDIEVYERRRGIELPPWQADAIISMSKAYLSEMYAAKSYDAMPAWEYAEKMWLYVRNEVASRSWDRINYRTE